MDKTPHHERHRQEINYSYMEHFVLYEMHPSIPRNEFMCEFVEKKVRQCLQYTWLGNNISWYVQLEETMARKQCFLIYQPEIQVMVQSTIPALFGYFILDYQPTCTWGPQPAARSPRWLIARLEAGLTIRYAWSCLYVLMSHIFSCVSRAEVAIYLNDEYWEKSVYKSVKHYRFLCKNASSVRENTV